MTDPKPSLLGIAIRDIARLRFVLSTIARHGFGELLLRSPLARLVGFGGLPDQDAELGSTPEAMRFAHLLGALGPTFTKLGQILSMRHDLFSPEYIRALETLQDNAPVLAFDQIREVIERGLGQTLEILYATFDQSPLATASIAQTHRATTHDGAQVVVKVQRPGISSVVRGDLDLLYLLAKSLEATIDEAQLLSASDIIVEFERGLLQELNFHGELSNLLAARHALDPERNVRVPKPYPELSCHTVLTMEFFAGKPLRVLEPGSEMAKHAVEEIVHAAFKQVMLDGFFHGDPHAGNILVNDDGELCMIDLGLMGRLTREQRDDLVTLALAIASNDVSTIARLILQMGTPTQRVILADLKSEIARFRSDYLLVTNVADVDATQFVQSFGDAAGRFRIKLATEYTILTKAAAAIEGIIRQLHPSVDILGISQIYARKIMAERFAPQKLLHEALGGVTGIASLIRHLPTQLDQVLHDLETGNLQVRAVTPELDHLPAKLHQFAGRMSLTVFATAMSVCAAIVLPASTKDTFRVVLTTALVLASGTAWIVLWAWHWLARGKPLQLRPFFRFFRR